MAVIFLILLAISGSPEEGKLKEVIIKEKITPTVKGKKKPIEIRLEPLDAILPKLKTPEELLRMEIPEFSYSEVVSSYCVIDENIPYKPWLNSIIDNNDLRFIVEIRKEKKKYKKWELLVIDLRGEIFSKIKGKKFPPQIIKWKGYNKKGKIVRVGNFYSYMINLFDKSGRKTSKPGKAFKIDALKHQERNGLFIDISEKVLFKIEAGKLKLTPQAKYLFDESADIIKRHYDFPIEVRAYAESKAIASEEAKIVAEEITKRLIFSEEKIKLVSEASSPQNRFIQIIIYNK